MIDFPPSYPEMKLLRRVVAWAQKNKEHIVSLTDLAPKRKLEDLTSLGREWQKAGLGTLIEVSEHGHRSVHFSLDEGAVAVVDAERRKSILGRLASIPRSEWIAFAALAVSIVALFN